MITFIFIYFLVIPLSSSREIGEHDALCGSSDSCYALFYQRRGFLESWRACRERGGNLATVKNYQEAALIEQLLTSSAGSQGDGEHVQLRFWIGLQRQPRQCAPQKPLRGFTWTTGDQDTAFTNWALQPVSLGPPGSCSAPRCVAIGLGYGKAEDDFKWLEGSCTLPVDGFVCKFRYQGMCPALSESYIRYSVPFGYHGTWLDRLPFGTIATVTCEGQQQEISVLCMLKEDGTIGWNLDEPICHASDTNPCQECQQLCEKGVCDCQEGYHLQHDGRSCELDDVSLKEHDTVYKCPCEYRCLDLSGAGQRYQCICPEGYQLAADGHQCEDIDECEEEDEAPCEQSCQNGPGSYICSCNLGFSVSEDDPQHCMDVDECQIAGVCQQMCVNYVGGFECFCSEGYELHADGVSCKLIRHTETRYEPTVSVSTSEEESDDEEWYQEEVEGEHFMPEWEMIGAITDGTESKWDSSDHSESQNEWMGMETTAQVETSMASTTAPYNLREADIFPEITATEQNTVQMNYLDEWKEDIGTAMSTTTMSAQKTSHVMRQNNDMGTNFQTTPTSYFSTYSNLSDNFASEKMSTDSSSSKENLASSETSWKAKNIPSGLDHDGNMFYSPTTFSLKEEMDTSLTTVPLSGYQFNKNNHEVVSQVLSTISPILPQESRSKRDNRWLVVALLVPLCVFLVVMLALGIVYCTRCGGDSKPRSVTDCYHWVTGGGPEKGLSPTGCETNCMQAGV